jgi:ATP-dependent Clp protease, protease subunit
MIHQPHGGVGGQVSDIEIQAKEIIETREVLNGILASHSEQSVEQIAKDTERDFYMSADHSKEYGLVDQVLRREDKKEDKKEEAKA